MMNNFSVDDSLYVTWQGLEEALKGIKVPSTTALVETASAPVSRFFAVRFLACGLVGGISACGLGCNGYSPLSNRGD